ncbi:hypothetical protein GCG54_00015364 [Colletotrichum gloeosporioides]|uniref:Uncharacterized protein n=1 Tax=Colletotrichum gloeosporioides TaxID=474922 RepID=A0A8H4CQF4_COLGL|nr:uncharacterized protein GCG54_00015364 [Colletotrichum gloeosporioides]KAF3807982.1 hypothetical protein GCG54_00015364 [Colletotrichum gloeosporioides]
MEFVGPSYPPPGISCGSAEFATSQDIRPRIIRPDPRPHTGRVGRCGSPATPTCARAQGSSRLQGDYGTKGRRLRNNQQNVNTLNTAITATGFLGCAWWADTVGSTFLHTVPVALSTGPGPQYALRARDKVYTRGAATGRTLELATLVSLGFVAYRQYQEHEPLRALLFAGASSTLIFTVPTNNALLTTTTGAVTIT